MNVLILSEALWPKGSGGELATYLYAKLLSQNGVNVKIVMPSRSSSLESVQGELSVYVLPAEGYGKYMLLELKKLKKHVEWSDLVYCTGFFSLIPSIKRRFKKPVVAHIHSYFPACPVGSLYDLSKNSPCEHRTWRTWNCAKCIWYYERSHLRPSRQALASMVLNSSLGRFFLYSLKFADALIFVSKAQRSLFLEYASDFLIPSYVIYNPLPELSYIPLEGNDLGYFGGLSPLKGFHILLKAWSKVRLVHQARIHAAKMMDFIGLESLKRIGILSYGRLYGSSYEDVYRKIKAVIFPSICQEPLPYVVSEALLRGRLLVASCVGGVPEIVEGLKGVFMVKPNDVFSLADALERVLSIGKSEAVELGLKNREGVLRRFDNQRAVNQLIRVFEEVTRRIP